MDSPSDESDPWMTEDKCISSDFVLVTRPLDSVRLADVWLRKEKLPDAATSHRLTHIRKNFAAKDNNTGATKTGLSDTQDECFLRDMLKAFTAKKPATSAVGVNSSFASSEIVGDSTNTVSTAATKGPGTVPAAKAALSNNNKSEDSPTNSPTMITEQQWTRIWQQFRADIGREIFSIEGKRYMDADEAYKDLIALFKEFEAEWLKYQSAQGDVNASSLMRRVSTMVYGVALWPTATAFNLAMGILRAPAWIIKGVVGSMGKGAQAKEITVGPSQDSNGDSNSSATHHPAAPHKDAPNDPLLCEGLARFVVLLSQQSVLAFPYELLMHQFGNGMENVYVGEMRPATLPDNATEEEREEAEMACSMKVKVNRYPSYVREVPVEEEKKSNPANDELHPLPDVPMQQPPAEGYACSTNPMAPPIPVPDASAAATATSHAALASPRSPRTKKVVSAPFVVLKVTKEFRVFALDESEDYTLFHIVSEISLDVTNASDPVSVSWSLKPAALRPDRPTESRLQRGLRAEPHSLPAYATEDNLAPTPSSNPITSTAPHAPAIGERDPAAPPRRCDCLGGSMGYHRRDCMLLNGGL